MNHKKYLKLLEIAQIRQARNLGESINLRFINATQNVHQTQLAQIDESTQIR